MVYRVLHRILPDDPKGLIRAGVATKVSELPINRVRHMCRAYAGTFLSELSYVLLKMYVRLSLVGKCTRIGTFLDQFV